jgi:S-DNA-T family DNA segregation ATPase FtsK/SpoIIIE
MSFDPHYPPIARPDAPLLEERLAGAAARGTGAALLLGVTILWLSLVSWSVTDPSLTHATSGATRNLMGPLGAIVSDLLLQTFGFASVVVLIAPLFWSLELLLAGRVQRLKPKLAFFPLAVAVLAGAISALPVAVSWPLHHGFGGILGDAIYGIAASILAVVNAERAGSAAGLLLFAGGFAAFSHAIGVAFSDIVEAARQSRTAAAAARHGSEGDASPRNYAPAQPAGERREPGFAAVGKLSRAMATARHTAQRGAEVIGSHRARLAAGLAAGGGRAEATRADAAAMPRRAGDAGSQGEAMPTRHGGSAGYAGQPDYQKACGPTPYPHARGPVPAPHAQLHEPPPYVPPFPPSHGLPRMPTRGPAAHLNGRPDPAPAHHDPQFDAATEQASRAIAARFAPGNVAVEAMAQPAAHGNAGPTPGHAKPDVAAMTGAHPAAGGRAHPAQHPAEAAAARDPAQPVKRNALFGGLKFRHQDDPVFRRPPLHLLKKPVAAKAGPELTQTMLRGNARLLEDVLADFGVKGEVRQIRPGPVVTLFEFEPARGVKSSRVIGLAEDIARSMSVNAVRVAVVAGRNAIGIELPNPRRETVLLRELLETDAFRSADLTLPVALGKSIGGEPIIADLARMPHLLVAGTTGSGKSVGVNAMILSLLYRHSPEECRFLMIDPKMLELSVYNGIPHLLTPVVTDPVKAVAALEWAVSEMEERYKRMAKLAVRNIDVFNNRVKNARKRGEMLARTVQTGFDRRTGEAIYEQEKLELEPMPYIVVVIDEFADLMLVAGKEVEAAVQRLAQMARAAGIHIIMATQRPSVDVITGTIKANFPTRISFKVASKIDSRTILNDQGAEQLLGQGDMLYAAGSGQVMRVHGPFVADEEVEAVAKALRENGPPDYIAGIAEPPAPAAPVATDNRGQSEQDLYDRAVAVVLRDRKASTSYIQRRLSIGYNRAADLIERMEKEGVISPANAVGKRDILSSAGGAPGPADMDAA